MYDIPRLLFKYMSVSSSIQLARVLNIITDKRVFMPTKDMLNDPMEGSFTYIPVRAAGSSMFRAGELENPCVGRLRNEYRILSLTENAFSPTMWAYYADNYSGICLCFKTDKCFNSAEKIEYYSKGIRLSQEPTPEDLNRYLKEDMMKKHDNWQQEKEWRIVRKSNEDYLSFDDDLVGIVFGCKIDKEVKQCIIEHSTGLKLLRVHPGLDTMQIKLIDNDFEYDWSGAQPPFISNTTQLVNFFFAK